MLSYTVTYEVNDSISFDVEAEDEDEAQRLADDELSDYLWDCNADEFDWETVSITCNDEDE